MRGVLLFERIFVRASAEEGELGEAEPNPVHEVALGLIGLHEQFLGGLVAALYAVDASKAEKRLVALGVHRVELLEQLVALAHLKVAVEGEHLLPSEQTDQQLTQHVLIAHQLAFVQLLQSGSAPSELIVAGGSEGALLLLLPHVEN